MNDSRRTDGTQSGAAEVMLSAEATLSWHLFVKCPYCSSDIDLADHPYDDEGYFSKPIFNNRWDEIKGLDVDCQECTKAFSILSVEY